MEGNATYNAFNFHWCLINYSTTSANYTSQIQIISAFNCSSDASNQRMDNIALASYVASLGTTAAQQVGSAVYQESNSNRLGLFNFQVDASQAQWLDPPLNTQPNWPNYLRGVPVTVATVTDGTSTMR
jgi:hypothetical protein